MAKEKGIRVSEKYGLNPSLTVCFWCGESTGIALCGRLKGDVEAPKEVFGGYDLCNKCKEKLGDGVAIIEVNSTPYTENQPPIQGTLYPSGRMIGLSQEVIRDMIKDDDIVKGAIKHKKLFVDVQIFSCLIGNINTGGEENE